MEACNCKMCKRLFNHIGGPRICPACRDQLELKFQEVKEYIYEHKNASITEVSEEMEVPVAVIKKWVREERLMLTDAMGELECESCGVAIKTGRYCEACKKKMADKLESIYPSEEKHHQNDKAPRDKSARMRFLDN